MEASQSQLGSVHSDSWASPEGGEGRQTGGKAGQRLDDVVMVKVGRRVQSVYDDDNQEDRLTEATAVRAVHMPFWASGHPRSFWQSATWLPIL
jgi:hypothetical protein